MTEPRTELRDRLARVMHDEMCEFCTKGSEPERIYRIQADAVMSLFADVRVSPWLRPGYVIAELAERSPSTESETP